MVVKVEICVACYMSERERGLDWKRERERESWREVERDREMKMERIIIGK